MSFWQHCNNCLAIISQKHTECRIENRSVVACSCALWGGHGYSFFIIQNKSAVEIHSEVCSRHRRIICIDILLPYTKNMSLRILTADLFWVVKKRRTTCISQGATTHNISSISILCSVHFCEAIVTQFLQCFQKLKNYFSLQFHVDWFTKCRGKNRETHFWDDPRRCAAKCIMAAIVKNAVSFSSGPTGVDKSVKTM